MLKIKALNQESSSDEDVPTIRREAQVNLFFKLIIKLFNTSWCKAKDEFILDSLTVH